MNTKQKLAYIVIGGVLVAAGMIISPLNAQKDKFGKIECSRLAVVDAKGNERIILGTTFLQDRAENTARAQSSVKVHVLGHVLGGKVNVYNEDGKSSVELGDGIVGGLINVHDRYGKPLVSIDVTQHGGRVVAKSKHGKSQALLGIGQHGGFADAHGKYGNSRAMLGITEHGGTVVAGGKDGTSQALLGIAKHGGHIQVDGKGKGAALMGLNQFGNGVVSTYDKNGRRQ